MRFSKSALRDEAGSATLEFLVFGLVAGFAILFASQELSLLQHRQFVVQQYSKQIARSLVTVREPERLQQIINSLNTSYSVNAADLSFEIVCIPECDSISKIAPGALVETTVSYADNSSVSRVRAAR